MTVVHFEKLTGGKENALEAPLVKLFFCGVITELWFLFMKHKEIELQSWRSSWLLTNQDFICEAHEDRNMHVQNLLDCVFNVGK